jgi:hypothetical protein
MRRNEFVGSRKHYPQSGGWHYNRTGELEFIICDGLPEDNEPCGCWITDEAFVAYRTVDGKRRELCRRCTKRVDNKLAQNAGVLTAEEFAKVLQQNEERWLNSIDPLD